MPKDIRKKAEVISWLMFQMVSIQTAALHAILHDIHASACAHVSGRISLSCSQKQCLAHNSPLHKTLLTHQTFLISGNLMLTQHMRRLLLAHCLLVDQGGIGPMQGQANHFVRYAPDKVE